MQNIVHSVVRPELADGFYLDFETRRVDWEKWIPDYLKTVDSRLRRNAPRLDFPNLSARIETLLALAETFARNMVMEDTYIGNVELQLVLHSLISLRFEPYGSCLGSDIAPMISEITDHYETSRDMEKEEYDDFEFIMDEFLDRFKRMQTPIIDGKLVYSPGLVMGLDSATKW